MQQWDGVIRCLRDSDSSSLFVRQVELEQSAGLTLLFDCLAALPLIEMSSLRVGACFPVSVVALLLRQMTSVVLKLFAPIACDSVPRTSRDAGISKGRLAFSLDFSPAWKCRFRLPVQPYGFFWKSSKTSKI